jgi:hypothetical protein
MKIFESKQGVGLPSTNPLSEPNENGLIGNNELRCHKMQQDRVFILGAGISGLLSAWALEGLGVPFIILDKGPREVLPRIVPGCVYLHDGCGLPHSALQRASLWTQVIPPAPPTVVPPVSYGDRYHEKIWGATPRIPNSVDRIPIDDAGIACEFSIIFSMNHALVWLYKRYRSKVIIRNLSFSDVESLLREGKVVSTIPIGLFEPSAPRISKETWIVQIPESLRRLDGLPSIVGSTASILYNIDLSVPWYRASSMFGFTAIEFISNPGGTAAVFRKIISGPDPAKIEERYPGLILTGRWGRWQRGFLAHQTYYQMKSYFGRR